MVVTPVTTAPWRSPLDRALDDNSSLGSSRFLQLATIRADGRPANRTVVFRGFLRDTNQLMMVTDTRSEKVQQIHHNNWGEACWYFVTSREQFRFSGRLTLVMAAHPDIWLRTERERAWQALSDAARSQFTWPKPRQPCPDNPPVGSPIPNVIAPLSNFCLLLLDPVEVDHLDLRPNPHHRWYYSLQGSCQESIWSVEAITP